MRTDLCFVVLLLQGGEEHCVVEVFELYSSAERKEGARRSGPLTIPLVEVVVPAWSKRARLLGALAAFVFIVPTYLYPPTHS